jgi:hypothetical protein
MLLGDPLGDLLTPPQIILGRLRNGVNQPQ